MTPDRISLVTLETERSKGKGSMHFAVVLPCAPMLWLFYADIITKP
jgi:hypothetical protein